MAGQEGQLLINLKTNYPDVVIDIGKIVLGERSRKKTSYNQKRQRKELSIAVCALLNSGGGVVRMESEDKNYCFQKHGIGLDIEQSLRECISCTETSKYFTWMQQQSHLLLFVKTWSCGGPEQKSTATKPRICSLSTGLSRRSFTSVLSMTSSDAAAFLRGKEGCARHRDENGPSPKKALLNFDGGAKETPLNTEERNIQDAAARFLKRDKLMVGEVLDFTETTHIEFKNFSTENILEYIRKTLPNYVSAFANTQGGYVFFGVNDSSEVIGSHGKVGKEALEKTVADTMGSMPVHHFCGSRAGVQFKTYILSVYDNAEGLQGYVCAVRVEPFCCAVFHDNPESWMVMGDTIEKLSVRRWTELMTAADPDLSNLADKFEKELSLANGPPLIKPVYSKAGLQCVSELQECLYPVGSNEIKWKPETICTDLFSEYPGLENLMKKQIHPLNKGILIFSRSWAVDIGLQKKQGVVCDVFLVAENAYPVLYTVVKDTASAESENLRETAYALKQKLVNNGGYASKVCVIPQILHLNGTKNQMEVAEDDILQQENQENPWGYTSLYPENYILTSRDIPAFLRALVIVVLCFKSYLSDHLGCEIFNILTFKQYELLSKNLHKAKEQFVLGLPGTGKTIVALKIIERIRNIFHCSAKEILYICENQPLKEFVGNEICRSVTRVAFLRGNFPEVKHIVVDEAQNFRPEENWHQCARELVKKKSGIFWVFLDFFQSTHPYGCGLKFSEIYPQEWLTKVARNAKQIYNAMFHLMEKILQERNTDMPYEVLEEMFKQAECGHSLPGDSIIKKNMGTFEMVEYVTRQCNSYIQQGYPVKDIAILCSTQHAAEVFSQILEPELKRQIRKYRVRLVLGPAENVLDNVIVLDSIRRFSGLERRIVFGIHPVPAQEEISLNLLLCLASRANTKLHLLYHKEKTFLRDMSLDNTGDTRMLH
ncbi:schlafen family member 11-like [Gymnogyps californianus]|uniref:schlafen family member 11-like n=1 Tax=Gymnogyps californianus TaxID=33616 RepID=UPI0021CA532E|nr:schlafen family member 11-like [Gymnogyps californianus]